MQSNRRSPGSTFMRGYDRFAWMLAFVAGLMIVGLAFLITYDVIMRKFFNSPVAWTTQVGEYVLLYVTFLAAAHLLREKIHIRMTFVSDRLNARATKGLLIVTSVMGALICAVLVWQTLGDTIDAIGDIEPKTLEIPLVAVWWVIPFGYTLLGIQFVRQVFEYWGTPVEHMRTRHQSETGL